MTHFNKSFLLTLGLGLLAAGAASAQTGIGTGTTAPRTMLDVNGAISVTETTAAVSSNAATIPTGFSLVRLTGTATATVALTAATSPAAVAGQLVAIYNTTTFPATFAGQTIAAGTNSLFMYSNSGWRATGDGGNNFTASNGLTKTGSNVALGGALTGATEIATAGNNLTVSGTGNVGIGTNAPASTLDVAGAVTYRAGTAITVNGTTASITALTNSQFVLTGSPTAAFVVTGPTTSNGTTALQAGARMALVNTTGQQATLNRTNIPAGQAVDFTYTGGAWVATNSYSTTSQAMWRANTAMSGGGTTTFISGNLAWDQRFIVMNNGNGSHFSTSGFFDITMPPTGTVIPGVGGSADVTTVAAGIPLGNWQALYYVLPIGSNSTSLAANFRVAGYTSGFVVPENWVLVAAQNGDNGTVKLGTEQILYATQSSNGCLPATSQTIASGATTTYTLSKTAGILTLAPQGNACGRYWVAQVAYDTRTNVLTLAPGGYGNPDAPNATPNSGSSLYIQNSAAGCADGWGPNQPMTFSLSGQTLTVTNNRNASSSLSVRECDANSSNSVAQVQNIYNTDGTLTANRTVTQGSNSLNFSGAGNLVKTGTGNVGIGTATPGTKVDIVVDNSDGGAMDDIRISTYGTPSITSYTNASRGTVAAPTNLQANDLLAQNVYQGRVNGGFTGLSNIAHYYTGSGTTALSDMRFTTSGGERMRISDAGNVGIGTNAPTTKLDVNGTGLFRNGGVSNAFTGNEQLLFGYAGTSNYQHAIRSRHNNGALVGNSLDFYLWNYGTDAATATGTRHAMTLDGNGRVGFGTPSPVGKMHILTDASTGGVEDDTYVDSYGTPGIAYITRALRGTVASPANLANGDLLALTSNQGRVNGGVVALSSIGSFYLGDGTTALSDFRFSTSNAERMRISPTGNVGIGTTAPFAPLQFSNGLANRKLVLWDNYNSATVTNDNQFYGFGVQNGILRYQTDLPTSDHVFYAGIDANSSKELMRVTGDGKVGIGTSNPTEALEVDGNIRLGADGGAALGAGNVIEFVGPGVNTDNMGIYRYNTASDASELRVAMGDNGGTTDRFVLGMASNGTVGTIATTPWTPVTSFYTDGRLGVGMGATAPSAALQVNGIVKAGTDAIGNARLTPGNASQAGYLEVYKGNGTTRLGYIGYNNTQLTYVAENGAQHVFTGGNVGIGTATPTSPLAVIGSATPNTGGVTVSTGTVTSGSIFQGTANVNATEMTSEYFSSQRNNTNYHAAHPTGTASGTVFVGFNYAGTLIGSITQNGTTGVLYNTTSDIRLKENIRPTAYGLADVMKVQVRDYNYKTDKATPQTGFLAQQLYTVYPMAVTKGGDDAKTNPWTVDYSKLTPLLTKAIQEEQTEIEALKAANAKLVAENAALKAGLDGKASASTLDEMQAVLKELRAEVQTLKAGSSTASTK